MREIATLLFLVGMPLRKGELAVQQLNGAGAPSIEEARGSFVESHVWLRHLKVFADLLGEVVVDFVVARDAGAFLGGAIQVDRVVATLAQ